MTKVALSVMAASSWMAECEKAMLARKLSRGHHNMWVQGVRVEREADVVNCGGHQGAAVRECVHSSKRWMQTAMTTNDLFQTRKDFTLNRCRSFNHARKISDCVTARAGVRKRWKCAVVDGVVFTRHANTDAQLRSSTLPVLSKDTT